MRTNTEKTLTSANSILLIRAKGFNNNWVKMEGYAADNAFEFGQGNIGETVLGVDGVQSGGFTPYEVDLNIQLQANSPSRSYFDKLINYINKQQETVPVEFSCELPSIKKRYAASGFMVNIPGGTTAKKLLESATYSFKVVNNGAEDI
ncbi:phage tail fiber protein [Testudinibacter sp. P80/BLE/0925]